MQHLRWTEEENDLLRTHFPKEGLTVASRFPQRSPSAIASHAYKTLRLNAHISNNIGNLSSILPDRTIAACQQRLRYLMGAATTHPS